MARKWLVGSFGIPKYGDDEEEHPLTVQDVKTLRDSFPGSMTVHHPDFLFFRLIDFYILQKRVPFLTWLLRLMDNGCVKIPLINRYGYFQVIEFNKSVV